MRSLARRCAHAALAVTAATLVVVVLAGIYLAQNVQVDTNLDELIDPDAPFRERQRELNAAFPDQDDRLVLVVSGGTLDARLAATAALADELGGRDDVVRAVFAPAVMPFFVDNGVLFDDVATIERRLDRLAEAQPLLAALARDPGPARLVELLADGFEQDEPPPELQRAAARLTPAFTAAAEGETHPIAWLELAELTPDAAATFVVEVTPVLDFERVLPGARALAAIRALADEIAASHPGVDVALTGEVALEAEELEAAGTGAAGAGLVALVLVTLVLVWSLRSAGAIASVLVTLIAGLILTGAFAMWAVGAFTMISIAFAVLFIGLGVDFAIHVVLRAQEEVRLDRRWRDAVAAGAGATAPALLLCAPTTALAFLAFTPTGYVGLAELGVIAAAGMIIALVLSLTLLPALLALTAAPRRLPPVPWPHGRPRLRLAAAAVVVVAGLASLAGIGSLRFEGDPLALKDPDAPSVSAFERLLADPDRSPYHAALLVADADAAAAEAERLAAVPAIGEIVHRASFVPTAQAQKLALIDDARLFLDLPAYTPPGAADAARLDRALARLAAAAPAGALADAARTIARRLDRAPELTA
ncbi:MAG: MMPL family transporter, partial [Alphaproteobacteria bacterium]|nr:MMPL family transporter [Alphaproteobacteria bacterium]